MSMFKFELNQVVWYMLDNKLHSAPILCRIFVDNAIKEVYTDKQKEAFRQFGESRVQYATIHSVLEESQIFASKAELLLSL